MRNFIAFVFAAIFFVNANPIPDDFNSATTNVFQFPTMPEINMPEFPKIPIPEFPKIKMPEFPKIEMPEFPKIEIPEFPKMNMPEFPTIDFSKIQMLNITLPKPMTAEDTANMRPGEGGVVNGVMTSFSTNTTYIDGKPVTTYKGETIVNDNGQLKTYVYQN